MKLKAISASTAFILLLFTCCTKSVAQKEEQNLTVTILHLDSAFWNAYNNCNSRQIKNFFTDDLEFYHDKGGITLGALALEASLYKNLCSNPNYRLRREAVAGTVKVYPMQNGNEIYGAVITGEHLFYITQNGKPEYLDGDANFTHLWLLKNGTWKMSRVISYNHHAAGYINMRKEIVLTQKQLDRLTGNYKSAQSGTMNIMREGELLMLKGGGNTYTLYPQTDTTFFTKERDLVFEFVKYANDKPVKMVVKEHGAVADELTFEK